MLAEGRRYKAEGFFPIVTYSTVKSFCIHKTVALNVTKCSIVDRLVNGDRAFKNFVNSSSDILLAKIYFLCSGSVSKTICYLG